MPTATTQHPHERLPIADRDRLEQAIARGGGNAAIMRELGVSYDLVHNARAYLDDVAGDVDHAYHVGRQAEFRAAHRRRARARRDAAAAAAAHELEHAEPAPCPDPGCWLCAALERGSA